MKSFAEVIYFAWHDLSIISSGLNSLFSALITKLMIVLSLS